MPIEVRHVAYGEPAARALHGAVAAAKAGDPLATVTVVVPSNHVGVAARRQLAGGALGPVAGAGTGIAAVTFLTVYRLAELLGAPSLAAAGRRPVSMPVLAAAMRSELAVDAGIFAPVAEHPATESALVATYRELRDCSPAALDALARQGERAAEVVRLHRAVRARLAPDWYDEEDLLLAAAEADRAWAAAQLGALVVHLPQRLSQHAAQLLRSLAAHLPVQVVVGRSGDEAADREVLTSLARLGVDASTARGDAAAPHVSAERTSILTASDGDEEVRAGVRAVIDAVRDGVRLDRIAVLHASPEPYARLAHEQLQAAGIATNGAAVVPLSARLAGRTLLELLALPIGGYRRQDVFAWLSSAPILHEGRWAPAASWERLSREAAIVAGPEGWDLQLLRLAAQYDERAPGAARDDDAPQWKVDQAHRNAQLARSLRAFVLRLVADLGRAAASPKPWSAHAAWAQQQLDRYLGPAGRREHWPEAEVKACQRVELALLRLGALDDVEGPVGLDVFARTLELELEQDLGRVGRFGDGVLVGSVEMGIGLDLDLVVVLGLAEGLFPASVRDDSLLPDRERAHTAGELALRADRVDRQHRQLLGSLAAAQRHLLCVPRGDLRRSADRVPSRWILDLAAAIADDGRRWWADDLHQASAPWVREIASFDAGLRTLATPATDQEHRLRALLAVGGSLERAADPATLQAAEVLSARRSDRFTRFDGNLSGLGLAIPSPVERTMSPTRLERWADCPHRHLVEDLLDAPPIENPEDILAITPIDKGNLMHDALEDFLCRVLARPAHLRPGPGIPWSPDDVALLDEIGSAFCDKYEALGLTGRPIFWKRDRRRILNDLVELLLRDSVVRAGAGTEPFAAELAFGMGDELGPVVLDLPDGRSLKVRGRIDRVDVAADGTVHVTDYKTGSYHDGYRNLLNGDPIGHGTKLQLPIYGLAGRNVVGDPTRPVRAVYWFITTRGGFARCGYDITPEVLDRATEVIGEIVRGIEDGIFPPHPEERSTFFRIACHVCNPDGLGTTELRGAWERKRLDPLLARYADLAEPWDEDAEPEDVAS